MQMPSQCSNRAASVPKLICSIRLIIAILSCLCLVVNYLQRVNLTQAIVSMTDNGTAKVNHTASPMINTQVVNETSNRIVVHWDRKVQGTILASYFYGYLLTQAIGGILSYKIGPQKVLVISVAGSSICTLLTPFAAKISPIFMFIDRFLLGFFASVNWPALLHLLSEWAPKQERSRLISISNSGAQLGTIVALPLSGVLCDQRFLGGWPLVFYVSGLIGIIWTLLFAFLSRSRPEEHHFISQSEREYICANKPMAATNRAAPKVPYRAIFTSIPCWGMFACHFFKDVGFYTLLTNISTYSKDVLLLDVKKSGFLGSIPYITIWVMTLVCGALCDRLINSGLMTRTTARKVFTGLGTFLPGIFIFLTGFVTHKTAWAGTLLFTLVLATTGFNTGGGMYCSANDMAPRYAGIIWGISNTFGNLPGVLCPTVVGYVVKRGLVSEWRIIFTMCAVTYVLAGLSFVLTGTGEVLPWASEDIKSEEDSDLAKSPEEAAI
ncbi:hypothetical protein ACOME3_004859 [Neoechinorhynchus agilis]